MNEEIIYETPIDNNDVITITYKDLTFEIDMVNEFMMMPFDVIDLFENDNIETQMTNLFFRRLIDGYNKKQNIKDDNNININN